MLVASALARRRLVTLVVATTVAAVPLAGPRPTPAEAATTMEECLSRPASDQTVTGSGARDQLRQPNVPDGHTFDLRGTTFLGQQDQNEPGVNLRPINLGADSNPSGLCVVGGFVKGTHSRDLGWEHFKSDPGGGDGEALRIAGSGPTLVNGLRVDNMMNGFRPLTDGIEVRNSYFNYVRDDCVENDDLRAVKIVDSLWDGCFTVFSQRPGSASAVPSTGPRDTSLLEIERVLVRMYPMPGGHQLYDASLESFGKLWKWSDVAGPAVIRDSIIMAEDRGDKAMGNSLDWPSNVTADNVTIVWAGSGSYPGKLPASGVTVTKDTSVWFNARADWLARHGCTDIDHCDPRNLTAPGGSRQTSGTDGPFADIANSPHADAIVELAEAGLTSGCRDGLFCPGAPVTRGQMATFLSRLQDLPPGDAAFTDVPSSSAHAPGIGAVAAAGIADGFPDGTYRPHDVITRAQMAAFLQRALDLPAGSAGSFDDTAGTHHAAAIDAVAAAGITQGCAPRRYCPDEQVSRAQMASFLVRAMAR